MSTQEDRDEFVKVASVDEVTEDDPQIVQANGHSVGLFLHEGEIHAIDNRCPHMGFPLTKGTIDDGVLTCHWHHARFEMSCGDTFDPFADDVQTYPVEVRDGEIFVQPNPERGESPEEHWKSRLEHGLKENIGLVIAKSVIGLDDEDIDYTVPVGIGTEFGTHYRQSGWGRGLTTLGVMTELLDDIRSEDRRRALYVGLSEVAGNSAGEPPFFVQEPLSTDEVAPARLKEWFRENIEVRDSDGAERVLRTAIRADIGQDQIAGMLVTAATDHLYLDTGHRLDFINKAFETLDHIGWEYADDVLPSLVPGLASASRAEENSSWRQPIDVAELCFDAADELPDLSESGSGKTWEEPDDFVEILLSDDPHAIIEVIENAIEDGATSEELAQTVTLAAARRVAQFGTSNEFRDWNTVHHTYTYSNAVFGIAQRTAADEVFRGVVDAAMSVYLDRFLNMPPTPLPTPDSQREPDVVLNELMETFEVEADEEVNRAGHLAATYLESGGEPELLKRKLGEALLREDVGFHTRQNLEAAFNQYEKSDQEERGRVHLIATARYLSAHTPTRRSGEQTFRIAERLNRGEKIHEG